jgi:hypothetical protein
MGYLVGLPVTAVDGAVRPEAVKVEIKETADGLLEAARPGQVVARATRALGDLLAGVRPVAQDFVGGFSGMANARMRSAWSSGFRCPRRPMW